MSWGKKKKKREATYCFLQSSWRNPEVLDWNRDSRNGGEGIVCNRSVGKAEGLTGGEGCHRTVKATSSLGQYLEILGNVSGHTEKCPEGSLVGAVLC